MVCPANKLATLQKSYGQLHYFQILSTFSYDILSAIGQLTPYGGGLRQVILYEYIYIFLIHSSIDLKQINYIRDIWRDSALLVELEVSR